VAKKGLFKLILQQPSNSHHGVLIVQHPQDEKVDQLLELPLTSDSNLRFEDNGDHKLVWYVGTNQFVFTLPSHERASLFFTALRTVFSGLIVVNEAVAPTSATQTPKNALEWATYVEKLQQQLAQLQWELESRKAPSPRQVVIPTLIAADAIDFGAKKTVIGRGATAEVYAATLKGEPVAVKDIAAVANAEQIEKELNLTRQLVGHSSIVALYGIISFPTSIGFVMERMAMSLADAIYGNDAFRIVKADLPAVECIKIMHRVASGLRFCHSMSILHRDLKPANVLLSADLRTVKICDFGASRKDAAHMTLGVGDLRYSAPELMHSDTYSAKIDIFSFAIVMWELFSRQRPYAGLEAAQVAIAVTRGERPQPDPQIMAHGPLRLVMKTSWAALPADRPTAAALVGVLGPEIQRAEEAAEARARTGSQCVVCMDAERSVATLPCSHVVLCADCAEGAKKCPICKRSVSSRLKVFL